MSIYSSALDGITIEDGHAECLKALRVSAVVMVSESSPSHFDESYLTFSGETLNFQVLGSNGV